MSEQRTQTQREDRQAAGERRLQSDRGATRIEDNVVARIAGIAAQEIEGVRMGGGGAAGAVGGFLGNVPGVGGGSETRGVSVEVGEEEAAVDLTMTTEYGKPIPQLTEAVRRNVINRVENLVGLRVTEVNLQIADVFFPQEESRQEDQQQVEGARQEQRVR